MKKITVLLCLSIAFMLSAGDKVKISSVIGGDIFKNGFSATVKTTSDIPMMPVPTLTMQAWHA